MAEAPSGSSGIPWPTIFGIVAALGAVAHFVPPLTSSRPAAPAGQSSAGIDARLWQDPFQALDADLERERKAGEPKTKLGEFDSLFKQVDKQIAAPKVLAVMVSGLPYAEAAESRLRARLAVVSGMGRARFGPEDGEHLGFVRWPVSSPERTDPPAGADSKAGPTNSGESPKSMNIAYEWWHEQAWRDDSSGIQEDSRRILLLWLREDNFGGKPLRGLARIFEGFQAKWEEKKWGSQPDITVIGPNQSVTLRSMLIEADAGIHETCAKTLGNIKLLSPTATSTDDTFKFALSDKLQTFADKPDPTAPPGSPPRGISALMKEFGHLKSFHRMIASDEVVCMSLLRELQLRQIPAQAPACNPSHIAIIAEWDTLYGRALPLTFAASALGAPDRAADIVQHPRHWPNWIHRFSYLRGIDGKLPGDQGGKSSSSPSESQRTSESAEISATLISPPPAEMTEGRDQSDGLRRLSDELVELDRKYRDEGGIRAVGVLGSDVYDKLLILKALRKGLPSALFFTTDIDARYSLSNELQETKNLIVASPFGLQLTRDDLTKNPFAADLANASQGLQGDIPPFRDDYQTSIYFSTLYALNQIHLSDGELKAALDATRVYEIGRRGPVDLSQEDKHEWIHPPWEDHRKQVPGLVQALCVIGACFIPYWFLCYRAKLPSLQPWKWFPKERRGVAKILFLSFLAIGVALFFLVSAASGRDGEPFILFQGVSIWGSEAIRVGAVLCSIGFIAFSIFKLWKNRLDVAGKFDLNFIGPVMPQPERPLLRPLESSPWRAWVDAIRWDALPCATVDSISLWNEYCAHGSLPRRFIRVAFYVGAALLCVMLLSAAFSVAQQSVAPARGGLAFFADKLAVWGAVISMATLIFYVGDVVRLCKKLAGNLGSGQTRWPLGPLHECAEKYRLPHDAIAMFLDVKFLALRTEAIMPLIYYPCFIIFLMIIARSPYFAPWRWPTLLLGIFTAALLTTIYDYIMMRRAAEKVREDAMEFLKAAMAPLPTEEDRRARLQTLMDEISRIDGGAFVSLSKNPVVGAILLPFAGLGAWAVIQLFIG